MWQQNYEPVGGSLTLSALVASIPILVLFFMLGVRRKPAWMAALTALAIAFVLALVAYGMPARLALMSALTGAAYGLFPIAWIVFSSIMLYRLAVETGKFEIIKDSVGGLTNDRRLQALFIAFSFGAFIEGAAGFGAPVAVSGAMLAGLGFSPFYAAGICLMANTAPVAFGSIGIPVTTLAGITGMPVLPLSAMVGRLCAMISVIIPMYLVVVMAGWRKTVEVLPAVVVCGVSFAAVQFYVSNYMGPELTDILSSLTCIGSMVLVLKFWKPRTIFRLEGDMPATAAAHGHSAGQVVVAWLPYMLLVVFVLIWGEAAIKRAIDTLHERAAAVVSAAERDGPERADCARPAQPHHASAAGHAGAGALCRRLHAQLAEQRRNRLLSRRDRVGALAARQPAPLCRRLQGHVRPAGEVDADDRVHAGAGVPDELLGHDLDARHRARGDRQHLSVLQRHPGMARRVPDRERHVGQCAVRQPADDHGEPDRAQSGAHRVGELGGRRHGQDDLAAEHRRGRRGDRPDLEDEGKLFRFTLRHSIFLACVVGVVAMLFAYVFPAMVPVLPPK